MIIDTEKKDLVNFIVIGPGKSGTSWVYELLKEHPDVCTSSAKETLFFEDYYAKGYTWYHNFYKHRNGEFRMGEVSNTYIFSPDAAARIYTYNPEINLIATLRNPVERTFSHYLFLLRNGTVHGSFEQALEDFPDLMERGLYHQHLSVYLDFFKPEQVKVLFFDDLKQDAKAYAQDLFAYLDVAELPNEALYDKRVLPASKARNRFTARLIKRSALAVRDLGFPQLITKVKSSKLVNLLYTPYSKESKPKMITETRTMLCDYFADDTEKLSTLLGRDLVSSWLQP